MPPLPTGPLPRPIGPYLITGKIGAGGMANVYRARHSETGKDVALKLLALHLEQQPEARARFRHEAALAQSLRHPNILPVYDYGEDGDIPYLAMQLLGGDTLADRLTGAPFSVDDATQIVRQLALALFYAHRHGVIHRDIKPANILLDDEGTPYLADFGIAAVIGETTPGEFVGTAAYASPEQVLGEPVTEASDQYSLGVLAFELLTGQRPFTGPTALAVLSQRLTDPALDPRTINPALPEPVSRVFWQALSKYPTSRFPSVFHFSSSLDLALGKGSISNLGGLPEKFRRE
ncbi:MAG: serine/threonine protein kinase [Chloroflexi bacterium]|nr:serine/threonine protein kinase [Chloroflexota bacterium]